MKPNKPFKFTQSPETFYVEETLPYPLTGQGSFLFAYFEKTGLSTGQLKRKVSERTGVPLSQIRHAGLKDRLSTSRQWLCWEKKDQRFPFPDSEDIRLIKTEEHDRVLRIGHVLENRFRLICVPEEGSDIRTLFPQFVPNFFGSQRFGRWSESSPELPAKKDRFAISQFQSFYFNLYLQSRLVEHGFDFHPGDLFTRGHGQRVFHVDSLEELENEDQSVQTESVQTESVQPDSVRTDTFRPAVPTGPMLGFKMPETKCDWELDFLKGNKLSGEMFRRFGKAGRGTRRPLWIFPRLEEINEGADTVSMTFCLPPGSFATMVLMTMLNPRFYVDPISQWERFDEDIP